MTLTSMAVSATTFELSTAAANGQLLITANIRIPIDLIKYYKGVNLIDCIKPEALPSRSGLT